MLLSFFATRAVSLLGVLAPVAFLFGIFAADAVLIGVGKFALLTATLTTAPLSTAVWHVAIPPTLLQTPLTF